jgi:guanylate kinase
MTMMAKSSNGNLFIVAAPSGGGKTVLAKLDRISVSISHTTRHPRPGEQNGVDYFFVEEQEFINMIDKKSFIEYACVFNHYYGTAVDQINNPILAGSDVILDIDWQGARQIKHLFPNAISIFVIPPSLIVLKQRLESRRQDGKCVINRRMAQAHEELSHFAEFDYLIVNDEFEKAAVQLQAIVIANRLSMTRQAGKYEALLSILLTSQ